MAVTIADLEVQVEPHVQPAGPPPGAAATKAQPDVRSELAIARERDQRLRAD